MSGAHRFLRTRWPWLLIGAALVVRLALSVHDIESPGLQYDEVLFVNAATEEQPGLFLFKEIFDVPVMVFPYIGALKSWLMLPTFEIFGVRPATIRLPPVLFVTGALVVLFIAVRSLVGVRTAALTFGILVLDSSTFWLTRGDVGPSAIEFTCKCLAIGCAARLATKPQARWALALVAVLALGTFNKLNFIWIVNAIVAVSVVVLFLNREAALGAYRRVAAAWVGGLAVLYGAFGWYYLHFDVGSYNTTAYEGGLLAYTWPRFTRGFDGVLSGTSYHNLAIEPLDARTAITIVLIVLFAIGTVLSLVPRRTRSLPVAGCSAITLLIIVQALVTPSATAPWHYFSPLPFGTIVAAYGVVAGAKLLARGNLRWVTTATAAVIVLATVSNAAMLDRSKDALADGRTNPLWAESIYSVASFVRATPGTVVTADWGIFNQVWAMVPDARPRMREEAFTVQGGGAPNLPPVLVDAAGPVTLLLRVEGAEAFPGNRQKTLQAFGPTLTLVRRFADPDGSPRFEAYQYAPGRTEPSRER